MTTSSTPRSSTTSPIPEARGVAMSDALTAPPATGDDADLVVSHVVRPGYRLGPRLLRAADVAVDTSLPGPDADGDPSQE
jgi:hypothetical protein